MGHDHNSNKKAHHNEKVKEDLSTRLARIEGQVRGINKMIQNDEYCDDVLNQITSIQSALSSVSNILLENHIKTCVIESIEKGELSVINELMGTIKKMKK